MKLGICLPHYGRPIEVGRMLEVVRRAEDRGLDSVWVTDHVIVPQQANVIYREDMLDPLAVLPWLAGVTQRLTLGTSVVILPYRSPIPVAKLLASVDVLSGGRLNRGGGAPCGRRRIPRSRRSGTACRTLSSRRCRCRSRARRSTSAAAAKARSAGSPGWATAGTPAR